MGRETYHIESSGAALQITFQTKGGCCLGMRHIMGCRRKSVWDRTGLIMGCLGEEPKAGQGRGLGDLGRNKSGKREG